MPRLKALEPKVQGEQQAYRAPALLAGFAASASVALDRREPSLDHRVQAALAVFGPQPQKK